MSEMIDRVALALSQSFKDAIVAGRGMKFEETKVDLPPTEIWSRYARAAIEAMREPPTNINVSAVYEAIDRADQTSVVGPEALLAAWQAMIDAALSPSERANNSEQERQ